MFFKQITECTSALICLILSLLLGIAAITLFSLIITIPIAIILFILSIIFALVSISLMLKLIFKHGWSKLNNWCKAIMAICIIIIIGEIIAVAVQTSKITNN